MKRDMNLARQLLLQVEEMPYDGLAKEVRVPNATDEQVSYHIKLLAQAGLIEAQELRSGSRAPYWEPIALTWAGHEFLEAARDDSRWRGALATVGRKGGALVFEVIKAVLVQQVKAVVFPGGAAG